MGAYYNTGTGRVGFNVDVKSLRDYYDYAVNVRQFNGCGPEGSNSAFYKVIDFVGTSAFGYGACDTHDADYRSQINKRDADFNFFKNMISGSISSLNFQANGFVKAAVGLAISPLYYSAVSLGGGDAFRAAEAR